MLASRRMIGRLLSWGLLLTTILVGYVVVARSLQNDIGKVQANKLISPSDRSAAPPQFVDRRQIKMKPAHIPAIKAPPPERQQDRRRTHRRHARDDGDNAAVHTRVIYR